MGNDAFLSINNLHKSYGSGDAHVEVLKGITASVAKGEICVLFGPSGSGKSTFLNLVEVSNLRIPAPSAWAIPR